MGFVLDPTQRLQTEVRRVAGERLSSAVVLLDRARGGADTDLEHAVHDVRKRCKATRGLIWLVAPVLGDDAAVVDRLVRDAASELSSLRDAHAVLGAIDALIAAQPSVTDPQLLAVRARHEALVLDAATVATRSDELMAARTLLDDAHRLSQHWRLPDGYDAVAAGLADTYRSGRRALRAARANPTDRQLHQWRKAAKYLWYQTQLLANTGPSVLRPLSEQLDQLGETLGGDHDLAVLMRLLDEHADEFGSTEEVAHVNTLASKRQAELRRRAMRWGSTLYAEPTSAFTRRLGRYWLLTVTLGPEPDTREIGPPQATKPVSALVERERKFLVANMPEPAETWDAVQLRQGYLAADEHRSIRIRDAGPEGRTLTIKAGSGGERTELEWQIEPREFDAAWPHTIGRRVEKTRWRIPYRDAGGDHVIELDVFGGELRGLVVAEVEFATHEAFVAFEPPDWFGTEVTDDGRYTNAALATTGLPTHPGDHAVDLTRSATDDAIEQRRES